MYTREQADYMVSVLGVNSFLRPEGQGSPQGVAILLDQEPTATERELVGKMMQAISLISYDVLFGERAVLGENYRYLLDFRALSTSFMRDQEASTQRWIFVDLQNLIKGPPADVQRLKKAVWDHLKHFKQEICQ